MGETRITFHIDAPRARVYRALLDPEAVSTWRVPTGMTNHVHSFDAREGGEFRVSLTHDAPSGTGKSSAQTDTYHGRFVRLVPDEEIVEVIEFETRNPQLSGPMTIRTMRVDADGGTDLIAVHENLPAELSPEENEAGWRDSSASLPRI